MDGKCVWSRVWGFRWRGILVDSVFVEDELQWRCKIAIVMMMKVMVIFDFSDQCIWNYRWPKPWSHANVCGHEHVRISFLCFRRMVSIFPIHAWVSSWNEHCPQTSHGIKLTYLSFMWPKAEMLDSLSRVLRPPNQNCTRTRGCSERQLINGQTLASSEFNSFAGRSREAKCCDSEFWHGEKTDIVCDGSHSHNDSVFPRCLR